MYLEPTVASQHFQLVDPLANNLQMAAAREQRKVTRKGASPADVLCNMPQKMPLLCGAPLAEQEEGGRGGGGQAQSELRAGWGAQAEERPGAGQGHDGPVGRDRYMRRRPH